MAEFSPAAKFSRRVTNKFTACSYGHPVSSDISIYCPCDSHWEMQPSRAFQEISGTIQSPPGNNSIKLQDPRRWRKFPLTTLPRRNCPLANLPPSPVCSFTGCTVCVELGDCSVCVRGMPTGPWGLSALKESFCNTTQATPEGYCSAVCLRGVRLLIGFVTNSQISRCVCLFGARLNKGGAVATICQSRGASSTVVLAAIAFFVLQCAQRQAGVRSCHQAPSSICSQPCGCGHPC